MCEDGTFSAAVDVAMAFYEVCTQREGGHVDVCGRGRACKSTSSDEKYR